MTSRKKVCKESLPLDGSYMAYSLTLKTVAILSLETSVDFCHTIHPSLVEEEASFRNMYMCRVEQNS
jgi:hypothetical protein